MTTQDRGIVVQAWLRACSWKQQSVLLSALRGCDGLPKDDVSKLFTRKLRSVLLYSADGDLKGDFMKDVVTSETVAQFTSHLDHYPVHWLMHFIHAVELVGHKHPQSEVRCWWFGLYIVLCGGLHLSPESERDCDSRLADRRYD